MGNVIGNLTQGELIQVVGRLVVEVGNRVHNGDFADGIQFQEALDLLQRTGADLLSEYQDED